MRRQYTMWVVAACVGAGVLGLAVFRVVPTLALSLRLTAPRAEAWLGPGVPPAVEKLALPLGDRTLRADLYRPAAARGALLLVHGLSPAGRRHPELVRLARLLARHGRLVLVPEFEGLAALRLTGREVGEIRAALLHLARLSDAVGVVGFSFGAGPALLAAAEVPRLRLVASFGGYADLRNVITYITTGVHGFGERRWRQPALEYNRWKLLSLLVDVVEHAPDRSTLDAIAHARLRDPSAPTRALEDTLGVHGRAVLALILNRREEAVEELLARLGSPALAALDRLSPLAAVSRLPGRLLVAHGAADDSIPFTETLRLAAAAPRPARVAILHTFHHTGPRELWTSLRHGVGDAWNLLGLVDEILAVRSAG